MKNKGFTLIELLAVIVILAIIALIATPIVLGIIEDSRENSKKISAGYVISSVEYAYNSAYAKNQGMVPTLDEVRTEFDMSGATWEASATEGEGDTITTEDGVECTVVVNESETELSVNCGNDSDGDPIETEKMAIAPSDPTQTEGTDTTQTEGTA